MKNGMITGASDGIGLEAAKLLASKGMALTLVARNKEKLEQAVGSLSGQGHNFLVADLNRADDAKAIADHLSKNHYDFLINNAGIGLYGRFEEIPLDKQLDMMHLNMSSVVLLSYAFLKGATNGDALVNTASTLSISPMPGSAVYSATKAFVVRFSETLWFEFKKRGVYVLGFCPGVTATKFHSGAGGSNDMFPSAITQTPAQAAAEMVSAMMARSKPVAVSGAMNRMMLFMHRFLGRKGVVNMMGGFSPVK
jgi:uncharacterized protein